jgi:Fe-S cluster biogenesis protein NfuA/nitrite reductase/ring-hydroxylating ferredoxin subunit
MGDDELVAHLLLLHGLHPVPLEDRVQGALDEVRPYLESHGGGVELLGIEADVVQLRLEGSCSGCPSSTMTLKLAIENAIQKAAPEVEHIEAVEAAPVEAGAAGLLQIEVAPALAASVASPAGEWTMVGGLSELASGAFVVKPIDGQRLLFLKLGDRFYGYHPGCPSCAEPLDEATLQGGELVCASCARRYDVMRAGRCLDLPQLHLEPVPLLTDPDGLVRVALAAPA